MGLTFSQQSAVDFEGNSLLVSAAAGSGKTFVLSQRVVRKLTDPDLHIDADRLMILTFTEAAAAEMRTRITRGLREKLAKDPQNALVRRQLLLLPSARISTIHSACLSIIRENFHALGIDPLSGVAQEGRLALIKSEMLEDFIEEVYTRAENDKDIQHLIEYFTGSGKDRELFETVDELSAFLEKMPYPEHFVAKALAGSDGVYTMLSGTDIKSTLLTKLSRIISGYDRLIEKASVSEPLVNCYMSDRDFVKLLYKALETEGFDSAVARTKGFKFVTHPSRKSDSVPQHSSLKHMRDLLKDEVKEFIEDYLFDYEKTLLCDRAEEQSLLSTLLPLCMELNGRLFEKRAKNRLLSYDDIEKYALALVIKTDDGVNFEKTELAKTLSEGIDEIIIDEYQDCNLAQDLIFYALSKDSKNIFMVGDVKQSIYRFRGAKPDIFVGRQKNSVPFTEDCSAQSPTRIDLNCNFRSTPQILSFVNGVFERVMKEGIGGIDYTDGHALVTHESVIPDTDCDISVEIVIPDVEDRFSKEIRRAYESRYVAKRIKELVSSGALITDTKTGEKRKIRYSDIAILMRAPNNDAVFFEKALDELGIGCVSSALSENFFETAHVMATVAFLQTLDNPYNEIPLVTLMYSDYFSFTVNELGQIRAEGKRLAFYDAVKAYAGKDAKTKAFVDTLEYLRAAALTTDVYGIISAAYEKSGIFLKTSKKKNAAEIRANLMQLADLAADFESSRYRGLFAFIDYVVKISEYKKDAAPARIKTNDDCVSIMSVHKSKGLEYPVVFMSGTASLRMSSPKLPLRFGEQTGISLAVRDFKNHRGFNSFCENFIQQKEKENDTAEYLRLLYVALTRAKNRLYITACSDVNALERTVTEADFCQGSPLEFDILSKPSFLKWILFSLYGTKDYRKLCAFCGVETVGIGQEKTARLGYEIFGSDEQTDKTDDAFGKDTGFDKDYVKDMLSRKYAFEKSTEIPAKLSVSEIKRKGAAKTVFYKPVFMSGRAVGKDVGNATHSFLQFCDFSKIKDRGSFEKELARLVEYEFITERSASLTDGDAITAFLTSDRMRRLIASGTCKKEDRFIFTLPAREVTDIDSDEPVVIQGIIDCWFVVDNRAVIVDYKTDLVKDESELIGRYKTQLDMYERAIYENYNLETGDKLIYSFCLQKFIKL